MKKHISLNLIFTAITLIFLSGCYSDTINSLSTFKFQIPVNFDQTYLNRRAPDTSWDFTNLNKYKDYQDNKDRIKKAEVTMFNYWIDSLIAQGVPFLPYNKNNKYYYNYETQTGTNILQFSFVKFYLVFAKPATFKYNDDPLDARNWMADPNSAWHLLGEFKTVNLANYWRMPQNILQIDQTAMQVLSDAIKVRPQFYMVTEYSSTLNGEKFFDYVRSGHTLIIRFEVNL